MTFDHAGQARDTLLVVMVTIRTSPPTPVLMLDPTRLYYNVMVMTGAWQRASGGGGGG